MTVATKSARPDLPEALPMSAPTVKSCYDVLAMSRACGITDYTDGKYLDDRNDEAAYLEAQSRQAEYLLDQIGCHEGSRILDIGCGFGRILEAATARGAVATGVTISPLQVEAGQQRGLDVQLCNYRMIFRDGGRFEWQGAFDGIVANGSLEHFVQTEDAATGMADAIYAEYFEICRRLLRPGGKMATTAIHFRSAGQIDPTEVAKGPARLSKGSVEYHFANLHRSFGGWYPAPGQLQRCAEGAFELVDVEDGTHDYDLTSQYWMRRLTRALLIEPPTWLAALGSLWRWPRESWWMLRCLLVDRSWNFQFKQPAPFQLLRQTWQAI